MGRRILPSMLATPEGSLYWASTENRNVATAPQKGVLALLPAACKMADSAHGKWVFHALIARQAEILSFPPVWQLFVEKVIVLYIKEIFIISFLPANPYYPTSHPHSLPVDHYRLEAR